MKTLEAGLSAGVLGILAACTKLPKNVNQKSGLQPGETLFEAAFIKGIPECDQPESADAVRLAC